MAGNLARLRSQVELALAGRVTAPFTYRDRNFAEHVSTGISEIDLLAGGLPRGALTEIFGPDCSGRTSLLFSALSVRTAHLEACALIDGCDAFDPHSAEAAGVDLKQLLWVRCRNIQQTLRATDLLLQSGGFSFIAVDVSDISPKLVRHVPLDSWFRFRRAVEDTPTILLLLSRESNAKTCASLVLHLEGHAVNWLRPASLSGLDLSLRANSYSNDGRHSSAWLLDGLEVRAGILRSRMQRPAEPFARKQFVLPLNAGREAAAMFSTKTNWAHCNGK
jgi:recombination protein RecA